jgi:tetratricopeptide (TPR) repeat protein
MRVRKEGNLFSEADQNVFMTSRQRQSEQIQKHVQVIKAEADKYNAKEKAQAFYCRALNFQAQAEELMEKASYDEAYESFNQACQIFEDARGLAVHKIQKEAAEAVQFQVREAADRAIAVKAQELAPAYFEGAVQSEKQADAAFTDEDFSQAKELYNIAILRYAMAQEEGLEHRKNAVIAARQQADQSQKLAQQAGAREEQNAYQQALFSYRNGVRYFDQKAYQEAISAFESARTGYQQAQLDAENENKYHIMLDAKRKAEDEHRKAEHVGAPQFFNEEFTRALQLLKQAQHWNSLNNHEKATEFYEKAAQNFLQVSVETHSNIAFQNLEYSRQRVLTIQKQVRPFRTYAERTWDEAEKLKSQAENASQAKNYNQAIDIYEEAYNAYERTKVEADRRLVPQHRAKEETIISKSLGQKNQTVLSGSPGVKRLLISILLILLVMIGSYMIFHSASIKKRGSELTPQSQLTISKVTPVEKEFSLSAGVNQLFSVEVPDQQKDGLNYTWFLDGKEQAKGENWVYTPVFNELETASKEIKVLISDREGHRLEKIWRIKVLSPSVESTAATVNHPPSIVQAEPFEQSLELEKGGSIIFYVQANESADQKDLVRQRVQKGAGTGLLLAGTGDVAVNDIGNHRNQKQSQSQE